MVVVVLTLMLSLGSSDLLTAEMCEEYEVILTYEDEYRVFLGKVQKAPKGTRVLIRLTSSVHSLPLQFGTLR